MPNDPQITPTNSYTPTTIYKPLEILGIIASYFSQQDVNKNVVFLQGIYLKNPKHNQAWRSCYDTLRDENTQSEITLQIPHRLVEDINAARDQALSFGRQLNEIQAKDGGTNIGAIIAAIIITGVLTALLCLTMI